MQARRNHSLEQHHQRAHQARHAHRLERDRQPQDQTRRRQVEHHEHEHELPEARDGGHEPDERVDDATEEEGRDEAEREDVEEDLASEVGEGGVVAVGSEGTSVG